MKRSDLIPGSVYVMVNDYLSLKIGDEVVVYRDDGSNCIQFVRKDGTGIGGRAGDIRNAWWVKLDYVEPIKNAMKKTPGRPKKNKCEVCNTSCAAHDCRCGRHPGPAGGSGYSPAPKGLSVGDIVLCTDASGYTGLAAIVKVDAHGVPETIDRSDNKGWQATQNDPAVPNGYVSVFGNTRGFWEVIGEDITCYSKQFNSSMPLNGIFLSGNNLTPATNAAIQALAQTVSSNGSSVSTNDLDPILLEVGATVMFVDDEGKSLSDSIPLFLDEGKKPLFKSPYMHGTTMLGNEYRTELGRVVEISGDYVMVSWTSDSNQGMQLPFDIKYLRTKEGTRLFVAPPPPKVLDTQALDKLVLEESVKKEILAVLKQHENRGKLFDEWGLGETIEYGRGMSMMFWGGPGTGKTWGAHCIAKALGQELLVISAAEIQSQEPGAAERNIQEAFRTAKEESKVLFIDECDSLITTRADLGMVLAATVNCLLTEIEKSEGVVILATNRIETMDEALERRLALIVEFPFPKYAQRVDIWKKLLPSKLPLAKGVTSETLAQPKFSGGQIKNLILQAARLAAAANAEKVSQEHFDSAVVRLNKSKGIMGKVGRSRTGRPGGEMLVGRGQSVRQDMDVTTDIGLDEFLDDEDEKII